MTDPCKVAVATTSELASNAAAETAARGGNAVDCAATAALVAMNTEPGVCALAGGAYVTVWHPADEPVTIDGGVAIPGKDPGPGYRPDRGSSLHMEYGGGVDTVVGSASVGVPGALAACEHAVKKYGRTSWRRILAPSIRAARDGFPLPQACHYYLRYSGGPIFGRSDDGHRALHYADGSLRAPGSRIIVPHLADSLEAIAIQGARVFYEGELADAITAHVRDHGGSLTKRDLSDYMPIERAALQVSHANWRLAVNPPPAVGGAMLAAMLLGFGDAPMARWDLSSVERLMHVQEAALSYRKVALDLADDVSGAAGELLTLASSGRLLGRYRSASTVHTSAVDDDGLACAITSSSGYGSGEMPAGTGLWLNNCLGELELNRRGLEAGPPGARLPSNMAPGVARNGRAVMAFGSPGADRITTALQQFLINHLQLGLPLDAANALPRLHVEVGAAEPAVSVEPGLELPESGVPENRYPATSMYFGGVGAARFDPATGLQASADPRREGGVYVAG